MTDWQRDPRFTYDANISILYSELPLLERPYAAARDGFTVVESWWPFTDPVPDERDVARFVASLSAAGTRLVSLNLDGGDTEGGDRGLASLPGEKDRFVGNLMAAAAIVGATGCRVVNVLYGNRRPGVDPAQQDDLAIEHLTLAVNALAPLGATVVVETLNSFDSPTYPLTEPSNTVAILDRIRVAEGVIRPALLLDVYHLARMGHDVVRTIERYSPRIGHVQLADYPGRGRPGTGQIDFSRVMDALWNGGYRASVGLEYDPATAYSDSDRARPPAPPVPRSSDHEEAPTLEVQQ